MKDGKGIPTCDNNSPYQSVYLQHVAHYADIFQNTILGPTPWGKKRKLLISINLYFPNHLPVQHT
jgi:hypothetical protein